MAIAKMAKIMIVCHRSQASQLLEKLQDQGICQILNAEEAVVSKGSPELSTAGERPKDIEELTNRLSKSIQFLKGYAAGRKGLASILAPRVVIERQRYKDTVDDERVLRSVEEAEQTEAAIAKLQSELENLQTAKERLQPWAALDVPLEQLGQLEKAQCITGLLPQQKFAQVKGQLTELGAVIEKVGTTGGVFACLIVCLNEKLGEVQKLLRSADFDAVSFESMVGTVTQSIAEYDDKLKQARSNLNQQYEKAKSLAQDLLKLQILSDHYTNLLGREQTKNDCPATEQTVIFEGWVIRKELANVQKIVSQFDAAQLTEIAPAEGEQIPVEIENKRWVKPFEVVTRLYGMPQYFNVDPTLFLAPFFALFFGLCLTDAGYGLIMIAAVALFIKKLQAGKKLMYMLGVCAAATVAAGAITGGWFGDAIQQFIPALEPLRQKMIWFDPLKNPMMFFKLSLALGYIQIITGLVIAFGHNLKKGDFAAAVFDKLTWLVLLNSIVIGAIIGGPTGKILRYVAIVPAVMILAFSQREGPWVGRIGMGLYNLFSAIFYMGDVLSYLRLMALGMVTAGMAMAVNIMAKIVLHLPYGIGVALAILILVGGHLFNTAFNALGAFVHTLRLQFAEFFPKFFIGGGRAFEPLSKQYKYIYAQKEV